MSETQGNAAYDFLKGNGWRDEYDWGPSMTRQEFAAECDINNIMARYEKTGELPIGSQQPVYVDFTQMPQDLMSTIAFLDEAEAAFMRLPATVRKEFDNDPVRFVDFASNPENLDQLRTWELAPPAALSDDTPVASPEVGAAAPPPAPAPAKPAAKP